MPSHGGLKDAVYLLVAPGGELLSHHDVVIDEVQLGLDLVDQLFESRANKQNARTAVREYVGDFRGGKTDVQGGVRARLARAAPIQTS